MPRFELTWSSTVMKSLLSLLALLVALGGCSLFGLDGTSDHHTDLVVTLEEGETKSILPFNAHLTFTEKLGDSRCPLNVTCIWEGEVSILLNYAPTSQPAAEITLTGHVPPGGDGAVAVDTLGLRFTLLRVDPFPVDGVDQEGHPVRATVKVESP